METFKDFPYYGWKISTARYCKNRQYNKKLDFKRLCSFEQCVNAPSAKFMDMYIESAPKSPAAVGYRGVDAPFFNTLSAGQVLADPGYMPVTTDEDMAEYFATRKTKGGIIEITGMAGLGAVNYSVVQDEEEIILPRGTKLKIISVDEDTGRGGPVRRAKAKIIK